MSVNNERKVFIKQYVRNGFILVSYTVAYDAKSGL